MKLKELQERIKKDGIAVNEDIDPSKSDAGKGKSGDLRGTDHQHQYAQKTYFKHIPETGNTQSCTTV